jgi:hypothetical protein
VSDSLQSSRSRKPTVTPRVTLFNNPVRRGGGRRGAEPNDWKWCFGVSVFGVANGVLALPRAIASGEPA